MPILRNAKEAKSAAAGADPLVPGTFVAEVTKTWTSQKNGRYYLRFTAAEGPHAGKTVSDGFDLSNPMSKGILMQRVTLLGVEVTEEDGDAWFDDDAPVGKFGEIDVVQNGEFINIKRLRRAPAEVVAAILARREAAAAGLEEDQAGVPATAGAAGADDEELPF